MTPAVDLPALPAMATADRLGRLRRALEGAGVDALLVTKLENVRYLSGFTGSAGMLHVGAGGEAVLFTDGRYRDQAAAELAAAGVAVRVEVAGAASQLEALTRLTRGAAQVGLEAPHVSWSLAQRLEKLLEPVRLVPTKGLVEALRVVKDDGEVARIERACEIADVAFAQVKGRLAEEISENDFAAELEFEMRRRGADDVSFETIVASGPNAALPHHRPSDRRVEPGDLVVEAGAGDGAITRALADAGTDLVYGVPGGGANLDMVGALQAVGSRFVLVHTETAAAIMAGVTAELTGRPGVVVATRGPGAASALNGVAQAFLDRQALVVITDCVAAADRKRVSHQRLERKLLAAKHQHPDRDGGGGAVKTPADQPSIHVQDVDLSRRKVLVVQQFPAEDPWTA